MINQSENYVAWAGLVMDLEETKEHLESLIDQMTRDGAIEEEEFAVQMGHVYAHLNRIWNSRKLDQEISGEEWEAYSRFPTDIRPVG